MDQIVGQALATFRRINEAVPCEADSPALKRMQAPAALAS